MNTKPLPRQMTDNLELRFQIENLHFQRISLEQAESARLMNRVDSKYILPLRSVLSVLQGLMNQYYMVEINNRVVQDYTSVYYDTKDRLMYIDHHNRRPKRYKIRIRTYHSTDDSFLEIKLKTPSGKTKKKRIEYNYGVRGLSGEGIPFISQNSPYEAKDLFNTLTTRFDRITLVSKSFDERITVDLNLLITSPPGEQCDLSKISIVEIKRDKLKSNSHLAIKLKEKGIRPNSFSKYSTGTALLIPEIKSNSFKQTLLHLNKISND